MTLELHTLPLTGTHLVEASAGTGKTYTLTSLYMRLLLERKLEPRQILVLTYTRTAAAELRERIRARLRHKWREANGTTSGHGQANSPLTAANHARGTGRPKSKHPDQLELSFQPFDGVDHGEQAKPEADPDRHRLQSALYAFDEAAIYTIHGFCQRVLTDTAFESGQLFESEFLQDESPLVEEVAYDYWNRRLHAAPASLLRYLRARGRTPDAFSVLCGRVTSNPELGVVPEPGTDSAQPEAEMLEKAWLRCRDEVAAIWKRDREQVLELLSDTQRMSQNSYNLRRIRSQWVPELDRAGLQPAPYLPSTVERLTRARVHKGTKRGHRPPEHPLFEACQAWLQAHHELEANLSCQALRLQQDLVRHAREELPARKHRRAKQSYGDLLLSLQRALTAPGGSALAEQVYQAYPVALIDEFQDTDPLQLRIFAGIYTRPGASLFLIGDPKQTIYSFRGADVHAYVAAAQRVGTKRHTLATNWRSDPRLIETTNAVFANARRPFLHEGIEFTPVHAQPDAQEHLARPAAHRAVPSRAQHDSPALQWLWLTPNSKQPSDKQVAQAVASEIARLLASDETLDGEPIAPRHVAVLCRKNKQARDVQGALRALSIPAVLFGDDSVFDAPMADELERMLRAMAEPGNPRALCAALATSIAGIDGHALRHMREEEAAWDTHCVRFLDWHRCWHEHGFVQALYKMLDELGVQERLLSFADGERRLTDLLHLGELIHTAAIEGHLGPQALVHWLSRMRHDASLRVTTQSAQVRLESDAHAVTLTTIHKSKGLEYPIVYCPFLHDGTLLFSQDPYPVVFHDSANEKRRMLDLRRSKDSPHRAAAEHEALAENLRLVYVALTRAKHRTCVVWGPFRSLQASALGYLLHQPEQATDEQLVSATRERIRGLDAGRLREELRELCQRTQGAMAITELQPTAGPAYRVEASVTQALAARSASRVHTSSWRISSYSQLAATQAQTMDPSEQEGLDRDAHVLAEPETQRLAEASQRSSQAEITLATFPAGAGAGQALHDILEQLDFQLPAAAQQSVIREKLRQHGFAPSWTPTVCEALDSVLQTELDPGLRLCAVAAPKRLNELEFMLPVGTAASAERKAEQRPSPAAPDARPTRLTPARLASVFERNAAPCARPDYHHRLSGLQFEDLDGFLRGYIDLVFAHGGRWYLVDYKSNWLGPRPEDYRPKQLGDAMVHSHYILQYHLYVLALHRYLSLRLVNYRYERDFGGVYYLFLRGMDPRHPARTGVFRDKPTLTMVQELEAALGRAGTSRPGPSNTEAGSR